MAIHRHRPGSLVFFVEIFFGNVILRKFVRVDFLLVRVIGLFDSGNHARLEGIPFIEKLVDAFGTGKLSTGCSTKIRRLCRRAPDARKALVYLTPIAAWIGGR